MQVAVHVLREATPRKSTGKRAPGGTKQLTRDIQEPLDLSAETGLSDHTLALQIDKSLDSAVWNGTRFTDRIAHFDNSLGHLLTNEVEKSLLAQEDYDSFEARMLDRLGVSDLEEPLGPLRDMDTQLTAEARLAWNKAMIQSNEGGDTVLVWRCMLLSTSTPECIAAHGQLMDDVDIDIPAHWGCLCSVITIPNPDSMDPDTAAAGQAYLEQMAAEREDAQSGGMTEAWRPSRFASLRRLQQRADAGVFVHPALLRPLRREASDCGAGPGGFQPGNTCAQGDGSGSAETFTGAKEEVQALGKALLSGYYAAIAKTSDATPYRNEVKASIQRDLSARLTKLNLSRADVQKANALLGGPAENFRQDADGTFRTATDAEVVSELAGRIVDVWGDTSGDHDARAVGIQRAAQSEFGLQHAEMSHLSQVQDNVSSYIENSSAIHAVLRAQYENTQEFLKSHGIENVTVFRGIGLRESYNADTWTDVRLQPLSSFTAETEIARRFARYSTRGEPAVIALRVPASQVFSTSMTGNGCVPESELVMLGGQHRAYITNESAKVLEQKFGARWVDSQSRDYD